ncbi:MAG: hypothetical protein ACRECH_12340 [Nitrososphaerales archaeon]
MQRRARSSGIENHDGEGLRIIKPNGTSSLAQGCNPKSRKKELLKEMMKETDRKDIAVGFLRLVGSGRPKDGLRSFVLQYRNSKFLQSTFSVLSAYAFGGQGPSPFPQRREFNYLTKDLIYFCSQESM